MDETLLKLRILASAELKLARIMSRRLANRATLFAIAAGLLLLAVVMVDIGAYQMLTETYSESVSAFLVAAGNGVLAALVVFAARRIQPGPEERMAREISEMALDELIADVDELKEELGTDVKRLRTGLSILKKGSSIGAGLASIAPVIAMVVETVKEHRKEKKAQAEESEPG